MTARGRLLREALTLLRFGIVGIAATATHFGVLSALLAQGFVGPVAANALAWLTAVAVSFLGHHYWTYRADAPLARSFAKFIGASGGAFLVSTVLLVFLLRVVHMRDGWAAFLAAASVPAVSFLAFRLWVFRTPRG